MNPLQAMALGLMVSFLNNDLYVVGLHCLVHWWLHWLTDWSGFTRTMLTKNTLELIQKFFVFLWCLVISTCF
jgi:hypothetical protein